MADSMSGRASHSVLLRIAAVLAAITAEHPSAQTAEDWDSASMPETYLSPLPFPCKSRGTAPTPSQSLVGLPEGAKRRPERAKLLVRGGPQRGALAGYRYSEGLTPVHRLNARLSELGPENPSENVMSVMLRCGSSM
jgi:hypothetical protein